MSVKKADQKVKQVIYTYTIPLTQVKVRQIMDLSEKMGLMDLANKSPGCGSMGLMDLSRQNVYHTITPMMGVSC